MPSEEHISSLYTSFSLHALLLLAGVCLGLLLWSHKDCLRDGWLALISHLERRYKETPRFLTWLTSWLFCLLSTTLTLYVACSNGGVFQWRRFGWMMLMVFGCKILIDLLMYLTGYVFDFKAEVRIGREQRMSLWVLLSLILFIETTVAVYRPVSAFYSGIFPMIVMALALLAIGIKLLRVFLYKPLSVMYIAFYWLTVEVLPIVGVWYSAKEIL